MPFACPVCNSSNQVRDEYSYCEKCKESFSEFERLFGVVDQAVANIDFEEMVIKSRAAVGLLRMAVNYYKNNVEGFNKKTAFWEIDPIDAPRDTTILAQLKNGDYRLGTLEESGETMFVTNDYPAQSYNLASLKKLFELRK